MTQTAQEFIEQVRQITVEYAKANNIALGRLKRIASVPIVLLDNYRDGYRDKTEPIPYFHKKDLRGITFHTDSQEAFIEVFETSNPNPLTLARTVIHELAHIAASPIPQWEPSHGPTWQAATDMLGLKLGTVGLEDWFLGDQPSYWHKAIYDKIMAQPYVIERSTP